MDILQKIVVTSWVLNDLGLHISYKITDNDQITKHYVAAIEDLTELMEGFNISPATGLSQHDAIVIVAAHEALRLEFSEAMPILDPLYTFFKSLDPKKSL